MAGDDLRRGLVVGVGAAAVVALVLAVALAVPAAEGALEVDDVAADATATRWFVPLVRIPLGTAVFEEVLFRSVLFGLLVRSRGTRPALVTTSVLFGLWHVVPAWESASGGTTATIGAIVGTVAVTTAAGVVFGVLRTWSGSVVAPVVAHTATNSLAYVAAILALDVID